METFVQVTREGKIESPDFLKVRVGNQILNFNNKQVREMDANEKAEKNKTALAELQKEFCGLDEELGLENEDDVMALIREIRYNESKN
ncbi:MAG: hypothetical protein IJI45_16025 [Anaerolineaceae bacterium]|nr:hypothetical protein [Anaerolineaceae bacterium]